MSGRSGGARICRRSPELTPELQGTAGPAPSPHARHPETSGRPRSSVLRAPLREPARSKLAALPCARVRHPRVGHPRPRHPRPHATAGVREEEADDNLVCFTRKQTQTRKQRSPWLGDRSQRSWGVLDPGKSAEDTGKGVRGEAVVAFAVARNRALFSSVCYLYRCSCCAAVARLCLALCAGTLPCLAGELRPKAYEATQSRHLPFVAQGRTPPKKCRSERARSQRAKPQLARRPWPQQRGRRRRCRPRASQRSRRRGRARRETLAGGRNAAGCPGPGLVGHAATDTDARGRGGRGPGPGLVGQPLGGRRALSRTPRFRCAIPSHGQRCSGAAAVETWWTGDAGTGVLAMLRPCDGGGLSATCRTLQLVAPRSRSAFGGLGAARRAPPLVVRRAEKDNKVCARRNGGKFAGLAVWTCRSIRGASPSETFRLHWGRGSCLKYELPRRDAPSRRRDATPRRPRTMSCHSRGRAVGACSCC